MTKVEKARAALLGQLTDSGEMRDDEANALLNSLVSAAEERLDEIERRQEILRRFMEWCLDGRSDSYVVNRDKAEEFYRTWKGKK